MTWTYEAPATHQEDLRLAGQRVVKFLRQLHDPGAVLTLHGQQLPLGQLVVGDPVSSDCSVRCMTSGSNPLPASASSCLRCRAVRPEAGSTVTWIRRPRVRRSQMLVTSPPTGSAGSATTPS